MKIIVITGQTATGKTSYAQKLAEEENGELINCDSRQIYKHLDIITGKDLSDYSFHKVQTLNGFDIGYYKLTTAGKHSTNVWLYDIIDPKTVFSSFDYQQCALLTIQNIMDRGKNPIIVGGTYFYIKHLLYQIPTQNIPPDWGLRKNLENKTVEELQTMLIQKSKHLYDALNNSDKNNPQRLIRKIEIAHSKKVTIQENNFQYALPSKLLLHGIYEIQYISLKHETKEILHTNIEKRAEQRIQSGAIQEVEQLLKDNYRSNDPGIKTIGYAQIIKYLENKISKDDMIHEWILKEKQYAKRQYTFMKKDPNISWKIIKTA